MQKQASQMLSSSLRVILRNNSLNTQSLIRFSTQTFSKQDDLQFRKVFQNDSTYMLLKKIFVYKLMASNVFINYSLPTMNLLYKILGVRLANSLVNKSAGEVFTSGESISSLVADIAQLEKRGIKGVGNYVVEGLHVMDEQTVQKTMKDLTDTITALTEGKTEGHLAIKLTSMIDIPTMTRLSQAQQKFLEEILELWSYDEPLSAEQISQNLTKHGVQHSLDEVAYLVNSIRFDDNQSDNLS